jgi:protein-L-isoaspartate(D-aspartate) O-methyltransferase
MNKGFLACIFSTASAAVLLGVAVCAPLDPETLADNAFAAARATMIERDLRGRGIHDKETLAAMAAVPRHLFVPGCLTSQAYADRPLPIGGGQTISQPYIVALMTQALALKKTDRVLEIGTGSGYQAAVLAQVAGQVYTIEIDPELAAESAGLLRSLGYTSIEVKSGDGFFGWPEHAPFDAIMLTCAAESIPPLLVNQLKEGGRIIMPLGPHRQPQHLILGTRHAGELNFSRILPVRFVPMTGEILN